MCDSQGSESDNLLDLMHRYQGRLMVLEKQVETLEDNVGELTAGAVRLSGLLGELTDTISNLHDEASGRFRELQGVLDRIRQQIAN